MICMAITIYFMESPVLLTCRDGYWGLGQIFKPKSFVLDVIVFKLQQSWVSRSAFFLNTKINDEDNISNFKTGIF